MELRMVIDEVDYGTLAARLLPLVPEGTDLGLGSMLLGSVKNSPGLVKGMVDAMPKEKKDELVASLINRNSDQIRNAITNVAAKQGVKVRISRVAAKA